jgi:hypothetical protein
MNLTSKFVKINLNKIKSGLLPIGVMLYFVVFHYANNVSIVSLSSSLTMLLIFPAIGFLMFIIYHKLFSWEVHQASLGAFIFILFFLTYGSFFDWLLKIDLITVKHYSVLPLAVIVAFSISKTIKRISSQVATKLWLILSVVVLFLIIFNLIRITPVEIRKVKLNSENSNKNKSVSGNSVKTMNYPDIYYIILDEGAGFDVIREYFNYEKIDDFVEFLDKKGFYVAEESRTNSLNTLEVMAERLNYEEYPGDENELFYFEKIINNRTMRHLKTKGYSFVVLNQMGGSFGYPNMPQLEADYQLESDENLSESTLGISDGLDRMIIEPTMLKPLINKYDFPRPVYEKHASQIFYVMDKIGNINAVDEPKFVYIHLLLPHRPFMFSADGNIIEYKNFNNWNYYLGNYIFSISVAEKMISNIIKNSKENRMPVIILQSDHGARNIKKNEPDLVVLDDYPDKNRYDIINSVFIPNCNNLQLTQDLDPINIFPIVFNCLFYENIPSR